MAKKQRFPEAGMIAAALMVSAGLPLTATPASGQEIYIKAGALVDPAAGTVDRDVVIRIEGDTIADVRPGGGIPDGADVIDLGGMYVLPGLIDCHTHLCSMIRVPAGLGDAFTVYTVEETLGDRVLQSVANARDMLRAGFTTVRDVGNCGEWGDIAVRKAIARGVFEGPTPLACGKIIAPFGGQYQLNHEHIDIARTDYIFADTHDEMVKGVRENLHYGADWIKIVVDGQRYIYTAEDVGVIVEEAERAGVHVCAHCMSDEGARSAVEGGVRSIEHGFLLSDEVLRLMKRKGVWLVGTDFSAEIVDVYGYEPWNQVIVDRLRRAHKVGVPLAFGSDVVVEVPGHDRGGAALTLLDTWLAAGIPDADILRAMTADAAKLLEVDTSLGTVAAGKAADIIAVPGNPLEDVLVLRETAFVMKAGRVFRDDRP